MCRAFLWSGDAQTTKNGYVSWDNMCRGKRAGGLGLRNILLWNTAAVGKLVWNVANKKDMLWVKWVNEVYIKGDSWQDYKPTANASWSWKCICKVKQELIQKLGVNKWATTQRYAISKTYRILKGNESVVDWSYAVWERAIIPKHRFILWLAMLDRLQTTHRLNRMGISESDTCIICGARPETQEHLFTKCEFSKRCWDGVMCWLGFKYKQVHYQRMIQWARKGYKGSKWRKKIILTTMAATIYSIWQVRNRGWWEKSIPNVHKIVEEIKGLVKHRILHVMSRKISSGDREWTENL